MARTAVIARRLRLLCSPASLRLGPGLSRAQAEVLSALIEGRRPKQVAADLGLLPQAVSGFKATALRRSGCESLHEFVAAGIDEGWITIIKESTP